MEYHRTGGENVKTLKYHSFDEKIKEIQDEILSEMDSLCTGCQYCNECPVNIKIHHYLAYNLKILKR